MLAPLLLAAAASMAALPALSSDPPEDPAARAVPADPGAEGHAEAAAAQPSENAETAVSQREEDPLGIAFPLAPSSELGVMDDASLISLRRMLLPAAALLLLGGVALFFSKRRAGTTGLLRVVESVALGPKRSLVVAEVDGERLVLACSEAGIHLLSSRAASDEPKRPMPRGLRGYLDNAAPASPFDELLSESAEDEELRRKLARRAP